jgi:dihydrofolate reductase
MRKVILGVSMSLDGRIARANGAVDFLRTPKEHPIGAFFACMDTAIMGRKTLDAGLQMTGGKLPKAAMNLVDEMYLGVAPVLLGE